MKTIKKILGTSSLMLGLVLNAWPIAGQQQHNGIATVGGHISGVADMSISSVFSAPDSGLIITGMSADRSHIFLNLASSSVPAASGQSVITLQLRSNVAYVLEGKLETQSPDAAPVNIAIKQFSVTGGLAAPDAAGNSHIGSQFVWNANPIANLDSLKTAGVLANGPRISMGGDANTQINALAVDLTLTPTAPLSQGWTAVIVLDVKPFLP
jgi:hypothetical protein